MAEMDKLFEHIDDIEIAMLTTRRPDGHLCSRAMATQKRASGADVWFVTLDDTGKLAEIAFDSHATFRLQGPHARMGVGIGHSHDHARSANNLELWAPDWQVWFPKGDDPRYGTADDPRMVLIGVEVHAAVFLEVNKPQPIVLFDSPRAGMTGSTPELGEMHRVGKAE